ncbi:venom prothrombin activator pseutarin-C non-catalytic subunit-like [Oculina patagonica]
MIKYGRLQKFKITTLNENCESFGPFGLSSGGTKDSQITASSSLTRTFLPYSAKLEADLSGWIPLRGSGGELHDVHFIQVDLRDAIQTKFMAAEVVVQGISPKVPKDKIFLVLSEDGLEWKEKRNGIDTAVDRSAGRTVTVMRRLKFTATARFVRVIFPPFQKPGGEQPVYKVELYGCLDDGNAKGKAKKGDCSPPAVPVPVGVGMESGVITDNQLTSSSQQGPEYSAQYSRLNSQSGGGAWCAVSCDSSEYLQIDLGQVYLIFELEVQSKHDESESTNSVLSFYFEYSTDGASWVYYTANGANKLFVGSPLRNLAVRHKLLFPVHAQFVRFRPQTDACTNMACMRVELFWYPDSDGGSPAILGRSFLLEEFTNTMFVCNTEVKKFERPCKGSTDGGETWHDLHQNVLNVLAFDPIDNVYYGISTNKKTYIRSKFSPFLTWNGINNRIWYEIKESPSLITATEVPFIPVMPGSLDEPFDALTVPISSVSSKRRRRSVASIDMWGCNYLTALCRCSLLLQYLHSYVGGAVA